MVGRIAFAWFQGYAVDRSRYAQFIVPLDQILIVMQKSGGRVGGLLRGSTVQPTNVICIKRSLGFLPTF